MEIKLEIIYYWGGKKVARRSENIYKMMRKTYRFSIEMTIESV